MAAKDVQPEHLDMILKEPAIPLIHLTRGGHLTTHDLVLCLKVLHGSVENFIENISKGFTESIERMEKDMEEIF